MLILYIAAFSLVVGDGRQPPIPEILPKSHQGVQNPCPLRAKEGIPPFHSRIGFSVTVICPLETWFCLPHAFPFVSSLVFLFFHLCFRYYNRFIFPVFCLNQSVDIIIFFSWGNAIFAKQWHHLLWNI